MTGKLLDTTVLIDLSRGNPDALIAASAIADGLELATDNERHYKMISELTAKRPY
jgi:predicted nucleic acid-binding protein